MLENDYIEEVSELSASEESQNCQADTTGIN
jgi:hypothetical protein